MIAKTLTKNAIDLNSHWDTNAESSFSLSVGLNSNP